MYDRIEQKLMIPGKPEWKVAGENQPAVLEYLYQRSLAGCWEVKAGEILKAVKRKTNKPDSWSVSRLSELFSGNEWKKYIFSPRRGYYGFNLT